MATEEHRDGNARTQTLPVLAVQVLQDFAVVAPQLRADPLQRVNCVGRIVSASGKPPRDGVLRGPALLVLTQITRTRPGLSPASNAPLHRPLRPRVPYFLLPLLLLRALLALTDLSAAPAESPAFS